MWCEHCTIYSLRNNASFICTVVCKYHLSIYNAHKDRSYVYDCVDVAKLLYDDLLLKIQKFKDFVDFYITLKYLFAQS